jgi:Carboxypeptidase regulatory-like domain
MAMLLLSHSVLLGYVSSLSGAFSLRTAVGDSPKGGLMMMPKKLSLFLASLAMGLLGVFLAVAPRSLAQETTGGIEGTVTDPSGAAVPGVHLVLTGTSLVGLKETDTDAKGFYHFVNLPPGTYKITTAAKGFEALTRPNIPVDVGQLHDIDLQLQLGATTATVEVTSEAPVIDVTTTHNITDLNQADLTNLPHGTSFQSVLEFAPQVRDEPLAGGAVGPNAAMNTMNGTATGGQAPGSGTNGGAFGFSAAGGADSENSYLVDGQETADAIGGYSHTNVPFSFIQSVQVKQSGIEAEYGGAMGAVMNVITARGSSQYHGSALYQFARGGWDSSPNSFPRYDPLYSNTPGLAFEPDATPQYYSPRKDGLSDNFPGFTFGGPLIPTGAWRDKLWFFVGFNPDFEDVHRTVNWDFPGNAAFPATIGPTTFTSSIHNYYSTARLDFAATQKIRLFGDWLYQYERTQGEFLPEPDPVEGFANSTSTSPAALFSHSLGNSAPNVTTNVGADITLTPELVATFRWGYNFQNYHDFGMPTSGVIDSFLTSGAGAADNLGNPIPASSPLSQIAGFVSQPNNIDNTSFNTTHRNQISAAVEWFHSGWLGSHDFMFGYQLQRLSNSILQHFNEPDVQIITGAGNYYSPQGPVGEANCAPLVTTYGGCAGQYGYIYLYDIGSSGQATSMNHAFFAQDSWQIIPGLTINAGLRLEHEYLPAENQPAGGISKPIQFGWGSKVAPRIGVAWDPTKTGKWKIFGSYGKYYDIMKLNVAISSFGGQYWQNCYYALNTDNLSSILPVFDNASRYCVGPDSSSEGNFGSAGTPAGLTFLENTNQRTFPTSCATCTATEEGVAPGLKPYSEHETVFGIDRQLTPTTALEVRWDRRRLDDAIEDAALYNPLVGETFVIVNPGHGVDSNFDGFYNFLYGTSSGCGATFTCPPALPRAERSYDGVEVRLTRSMSRHWTGMFSYTYSHLRGNYPGLTSTDLSDGGGGRNAPDNSRAFDEPYFYYDAAGQINNGPLNTDRPSAFKGYGFYELPWLHKFTTTFGIFQFLYQGSPVSSFVDEGYSVAPFTSLYGVPSAQGGAFPTYVVPRGQFLPVTQDPVTGNISVGTPYNRRTPWFMQTDFQISQAFKVGESKEISFSATVSNIFNNHSVVAYWESMDTNFSSQFLAPTGSPADCPAVGSLGLSAGQCFVGDGPAFYSAAMHGFDLANALNNAAGSTGTNKHMAINSLYGKPLYYQVGRSMYMSMKFTF